MQPQIRMAIHRTLGLALVASSVCGCGTDTSRDPLPAANIAQATAESPPEVTLQGLANPEALVANPPAAPPVRENSYPLVVITTNRGEIKLRLNAERAPETVDNFLVNYVQRGFYDETVFHHAEPGFIVAAGGFRADLEPQQTRAPIRCEASNGLTNRRGTVAMSRHAEYADSATCQFYINVGDNHALDPNPATESSGYCVFGEVVEGMEVVDAIAAVPVQSRGDFPNLPVEPVVIQSVRQIN
jgi:cyclophilin family peptidyl-prolyl cis-trans isomerase